MNEELDLPKVVDKPSLFLLFFTFFRLGASAFGGPAAVANIRTMVVEKKHWIGKESFREGTALCQTIPGATGIQVCAYIGLDIRGMAGAAVCFVGFVLPAFFLMLALSVLYVSLHAIPAVTNVFNALHALIVSFMAYGAFSFGKSYLKKWQDVLIATTAAVLFWFGVSPMLVVLISTVLGLALKYRRAEAPKNMEQRRKPFALRPLLILIACAALLVTALFFINKRLFDISVLMMKIDFIAYGGGFGSVPLMLHEVVNVHHWMDAQTFMDGIALGQVTPGPIVITSTFVGYILQGTIGALIATASIFFPSFVLVIVLSPFFARLNQLPLFRRAIDGILCSFVGLLLSTAVHMGFAVSWDIPRILLSGGAFVALMLGVDTLWVILAGIGISFFIR
jgi:chromate transporter